MIFTSTVVLHLTFTLEKPKSLGKTVTRSPSWVGKDSGKLKGNARAWRGTSGASGACPHSQAVCHPGAVNTMTPMLMAVQQR